MHDSKFGEGDKFPHVSDVFVLYLAVERSRSQYIFKGMVTLVIPLKISVKSTCFIFKPTGTRRLVSTLI